MTALADVAAQARRLIAAGMRPTAGEWMRAQWCLFELLHWRERARRVHARHAITGRMVDAAAELRRLGWTWDEIAGLWPAVDRDELRARHRAALVSQARTERARHAPTRPRERLARLAARLLLAGEQVGAVAELLGVPASTVVAAVRQHEPAVAARCWPRTVCVGVAVED